MIIVVDGYSTGKHIVRDMNTLGEKCIHVQSGEISPPHKASYRPEDYIHNYKYNGDKLDLAEKLKQHKPTAVIAGCESGVLLADILSSILGCKTANDLSLSESRRDKYKMQERLRDCDIPCVRQYLADSLKGGLDWCSKLKTKPVVLKPINSAGAEDVYFCYTEDEIEIAFQKIIGKKNLIGEINKVVLFQEYLLGTEYIVNTVGTGGKYFVADVWRCDKKFLNDRTNVTDIEVLCSPDSPEVRVLSDYAFTVLEALGIKNGPAHFEIMLTELGPILIEVGARVQGSIQSDVVKKATGHGHLALTVASYASPSVIEKLSSTPYKVDEWMIRCVMHCQHPGVFNGYDFLNEVQSLSSFQEYTQCLKVGDSMVVTTDFSNITAMIDFTNPCESALWSDFNEFRVLEARYWQKQIGLEV